MSVTLSSCWFIYIYIFHFIILFYFLTIKTQYNNIFEVSYKPEFPPWSEFITKGPNDYTNQVWNILR